MSPLYLLLIVLVVLAVLGLPNWGYSRSWGTGYYPSGIVGLIIVVLIVLLLTGRL